MTDMEIEMVASAIAQAAQTLRQSPSAPEGLPPKSAADELRARLADEEAIARSKRLIRGTLGMIPARFRERVLREALAETASREKE